MEPEKEGHERARNRKTSLFQLICLFPLNRPFFRLPPFIPLDFAFSLGQLLLLQHCKVSLLCMQQQRWSTLFLLFYDLLLNIQFLGMQFRQKPRNFRGLFGEKHNLAVFSTPLFCMMPLTTLYKYEARVRVPLNFCITLCFYYVIELLMLISKMVLVFHLSKQTQTKIHFSVWHFLAVPSPS